MEKDHNHLIIIGDSIFDNATYVRGGLSVLDHLDQLLPSHWSKTLVARDGDVVSDVVGQLKRVPPDSTHLVLSIGGNDALESLPTMSLGVRTVNDALGHLAHIRQAFQNSYREMLRKVISLGKPLAVCTIYEAIPGLTDELKVALALYNDTIVREALVAGLFVIDLREICTEPADYSQVSPIEPSEQGGGKIARAICNWATSS